MRRKKSPKTAQSILEFMMLMVFIILAFIVLQPFITRGINGRWKTAGDAMGSGRLYDPQHTLECRFDSVVTHQWYNFDCFEEHNCDQNCSSMDATAITCARCILDCRTARCCASGNPNNCPE